MVNRKQKAIEYLENPKIGYMIHNFVYGYMVYDPDCDDFIYFDKWIEKYPDYEMVIDKEMNFKRMILKKDK